MMVIKHFSNSHKTKVLTSLVCIDFRIQQLKGKKALSGHFKQILILRNSFYYARQFIFSHNLSLVKTFKRYKNLYNHN